MRIKDIIIGERYKIGYGICGKVLEVGVPTVSYRGTSSRRDGVRVLIEAPSVRRGEETVYTSREFRTTWEVHQEEQRQRELQERYREELLGERKKRAEQMEESLRSLGIDFDSLSYSHWPSLCDLEDKEFDVHLRLTSTQMDTLICMLSDPEVQNRKQSDGEGVAESVPVDESSALAKVFG